MLARLLPLALSAALGAAEPPPWLEIDVSDWPTCHRTWLGGDWAPAWRAIQEGILPRLDDADGRSGPWAAMVAASEDVQSLQLVLHGVPSAPRPQLAVRFRDSAAAERAMARLLLDQPAQHMPDGSLSSTAWLVRQHDDTELVLGPDGATLTSRPKPAPAALTWRLPRLGLGGRLEPGNTEELQLSVPSLPLRPLLPDPVADLPADAVMLLAINPIAFEASSLASLLEALGLAVPSDLDGFPPMEGPVRLLLCHGPAAGMELPGSVRLGLALVLPESAGTEALVTALAGRWAPLLDLARQRSMPLPLAKDLPTLFVRHLPGRWMLCTDASVLQEWIEPRAAARSPLAAALPIGERTLHGVLVADLQRLGPALRDLRSLVATRLQPAAQGVFALLIEQVEQAAGQHPLATATLDGADELRLRGLTQILLGLVARLLPTAPPATDDTAALEWARDHLLRSQQQPEGNRPLWPPSAAALTVPATPANRADPPRWCYVPPAAGAPSWQPVLVESPLLRSDGCGVLCADARIALATGTALWDRARLLAALPRPATPSDWQDLLWLLRRPRP